MNEATRLITESITQYRDISQATAELGAAVKSLPLESLQQRLQDLEALQHAAQITDQRLNRCFEQEGPSCVTLTLFDTRRELFQSLERQNDLLIQRLQSKMAVTAQDLATSRQGLGAMAGYRPERQRKGQTVQGRF